MIEGSFLSCLSGTRCRNGVGTCTHVHVRERYASDHLQETRVQQERGRVGQHFVDFSIAVPQNTLNSFGCNKIICGFVWSTWKT